MQLTKKPFYLLSACIFQNAAKVLKQPFKGLLWFSPVNALRLFIPKQLFGSCVLSDAPAVIVAVPVLHISEIRDDSKALAHKPVDRGVEALCPAFPVISKKLKILGKDRAVLLDQLKQQLVAAVPVAIVVKALVVVAVAPVIGKIDKKVAAHECRLVFKEFPVGAAGMSDHRPLPLPDSLKVLEKPRPWVAVFLNGKALDLIAEERQKETFVPELSLVAVLDDGTIIGEIALHKTDIATKSGNITQLVLSQSAVLPKYRKKGIMRLLVEYALDQAKNMGYGAVFLGGNPKLYSRYGFEASSKYGIYHKDREQWGDEGFMVYKLKPDALDGVTGTTSYYGG